MTITSLRRQIRTEPRAQLVLAVADHLTTTGWHKTASWRPMIDTIDMGASDDLTEIIVPGARDGYYKVGGCIAGNHDSANSGNVLQAKITVNDVDVHFALGGAVFGVAQAAVFPTKELYLNGGDRIAVWISYGGTAFTAAVLNEPRESFLSLEGVS